MAYNTGNPLGSNDPRDLDDNAIIVDKYSNGEEPTYPDRFGEQKQSLAGMRAEFAALLLETGYESVHLVYGAGVIIQRATQLVDRSGISYRVKDQADLPLTLTGTWATDQLKLTDVADGSLRADLATPPGSSKVGHDKGLAQTPGTVGDELVRLNKNIGLPIQGNLASVFMQGILPSSQLWMGDSNAAGAGQPGTYAAGYMSRLTRSIMNAFDEGFGSANRGYMYESVMDPYLMLNSEPGWSISGAVEWMSNGVAGGVTGTLLKIPVGAYLELTGREVAQCKLFYKYSAAGTVRITVNGVIAQDHVLTSAGRSSDINLAPGNEYIKPTDIIRIAPISGTDFLFQGFRVLRKSGSRGPITFAAPQGSQGWDDFFDDERCVPLTNWIKDDNANGYVLLGFMLGTNNIVTNVGKQKSPTAYVTSMDACIQKYRGKLSGNNVTALVWIPPRPNQATYAPYEDYVAAILEYARTRDYIVLVRMDLSGIEGAKFMTTNVADPAPGLHYSDYGHSAIPRIIGATIGVQIKTGYPTFPSPASAIPKIAATAKNTWTTSNAGSYLGSDGFVDMVGYFVRNGSTNYIFGNVGAAHIPADNVLTFMVDDQGVSHTVVIRPVTGQLELANQTVTGITNLFTTGACRYKLA